MNANFMWEFLTNEDFQFEVLFVNYKLLEGFAKDILSLGSHHMPEEAYWSIEKQITSKGYMFETHSILTDDGSSKQLCIGKKKTAISNLHAAWVARQRGHLVL